MMSDDQQCHYATTDDGVKSQMSLFLAANKSTTAGMTTSVTTAGNPIDKLYSMQTSYFTAN